MRAVFTPGAFSFINHGDAALVIGFLRLLKRQWPDAQFTTTSFHPQTDQGKYDAAVIPMILQPGALWQRGLAALARVVPGFSAVQSVIHIAVFGLVRPYLRWWGRLYRTHPERANRFAWRSLRLNAEAVARSEAVIMVPGGFLNAYRWTNTDWLYHTPIIHLAAVMGKPASLGPCTIGPFAGPSKRLAGRVLNEVEHILLRESLSLGVLAELGVTAQATVCRDVAFQYAEEGLAQPRPAQSNLLGVSMREHNFPGAASIRAAQIRYLETVAGAVGRLLRDDPEARVLITAQTGEDVAISQRLAEMLDSSRVAVDVSTEDPQDLLASYGELRLMLGTRMHANILSLCSGTPVVAIGYDPKTRGVMASLGLEDWVFDIEDLSGLEEELSRRWLSAPQEQGRVRASVTGALADLSSVAAQLLA